ncbi:hypothetical protein M0R45_002583 [Rubus argutus]|uniref:RING-type E3 ubiquitin transferase n=1 Tax=Rubus argutus TaxID=59490 RepID=A0AAW1VSV6_RUBAR
MLDMYPLLGFLWDSVYRGRKMQMLLGFSNSTVDEYLRFPFVPSTTFIAEGEWDEKGNRLCSVACRILNFTESLTSALVGDCSTKLSLRFPVRLSLQNRSAVVGQIWSDKKRAGRGKGKKYPEEYSSDMKFDMRVSNNKGQVAWGFSSPLFVDDDGIYGRRFWDKLQQTEVPSRRKKSHSSPMNISYKLSFTRGAHFFHDIFPSKAELATEGIYDRDYAAASITRIDFEIVMILISNTVACAFVGWQLYFVKKHPDVLPLISIVMLIVLTLGYMIPLLFNFEAMLAPKHSQQILFLELVDGLK